MRWWLVLPVLLAATGPVSAEDLAYGRALVADNCARCHAIDADDASAHDDAPAFRSLLRDYPVDALEEAFAERIVTGHPDMPEFTATPDQIGAIIGYIDSIQQ
ncbi:MAG: c-type cytochrome [Roseitalea sp.]|nr:c-type cytochrome [Roseitalea sp.]